MRGESLKAAGAISEKFGVEFGEALRAVSAALDSPDREVRVRLPDEKRGKSSVSIRLARGGGGDFGLLIHSFRREEGGFIPLERSAGRGESWNGTAGSGTEMPNWKKFFDGGRRRNLEREEKEALAGIIDSEGISGGTSGPFFVSFERDYALRKGLAGFRVPGRRGAVMPCPSVQRAARTYDFHCRKVLLLGTPFWSLRDFRTGIVRGVQFKFWNKRDGTWLTRTIGTCRGCWVQMPPRSGCSPRNGTVLCEGVATSWAVHELLAGAARVIASLGTSGLSAAAIRARELWPGDRLCIVADLDAEFQGERAAAAAAEKRGAEVRLPVTVGASADFAKLRLRGFDAWDLWAMRRGREIPQGIDGFMPAVATG